MTESINTMRELIERLTTADTAYYKYDNPIMTDREYDALYDELAGLERSTGIILSGSPTQKVSGEVLEGLVQVQHSKPMLSAQKTKSVDEIVNFIDGRRAIMTLKMDGLTLVLRYEDGQLKQAITRGGEGGLIGEDVTHTVRTMLNVPLTIPTTEPFEVRGEGVVSWESFDAINRIIANGTEMLVAQHSIESSVGKMEHEWAPTDSQGYSMECLRCGIRICIYDTEGWDHAIYSPCPIISASCNGLSISETGESYSHPRSLAAGAIRRLDARKTKAQRLEFFAFELVSGQRGHQGRTVANTQR